MITEFESCCLQELKSLAKRSRQAQDNSKPQRSGDSDSDLDSSEGSDDEVKTDKIKSIISLSFQFKTIIAYPSDQTRNQAAKQHLSNFTGTVHCACIYFCSDSGDS